MKDIKYIIKRVIIGFILGVIFMFLSKYTVFAEVLNPYWAGRYQNSTYYSGGVTIQGGGNFTYATGNFYGVWLSFTGLPTDQNTTIYGNFAVEFNGSGYEYGVYVLGHNTRLNSNNIDSVLSNADVVSLCFYNGADFQPYSTSTYNSYKSTGYYCSGLKGYSYYTVMVHQANGGNNWKGISQKVSFERNTIENNVSNIATNTTNIDNSINSDEPADDNSLGALDTGNLPGSSGPLSALMTLPITIINNFLSVAGVSCTDLTIPIPFVNKNATIPCVSRLFSDLGWSSYYETFGYLAGGLLMLKYLMYLYDRLSQLLYLEDQGMLGKVA